MLGETQGSFADVPVQYRNLFTMLQQLIKEIENVDIFAFRGPFVEMVQQAFRFVQDYEVALRIKPLLCFIFGVLQDDIHQGVQLNYQLRRIPDIRIFI